MQSHTSTRTALSAQIFPRIRAAVRVWIILLAGAFAITASAQTVPQQQPSQHHPMHPHSQYPSQSQQAMPPQQFQRPQPPPPPYGPQPSMRGQQHIGQWMASHQNLSPAEQQRALAQEPGFNSLPVPQQQRMQQRLTQLNGM